MVNKYYYKRKNGLVAKQIHQDFIIIDPKKEMYYLLNETGALIYTYLNKKRTFLEISNKFKKLYQVPKRGFNKDIRDFLEVSLEKFIIKTNNQNSL